MRLSRCLGLLLLALCSMTAFASKAKPCIAADEAGQMLNKDICISVHVYEVVEVESGARYLDVCPPDTSDERCGFTIVSLPQDRETVGELRKYSKKDVRLRDIIGRTNG